MPKPSSRVPRTAAGLFAATVAVMAVGILALRLPPPPLRADDPAPKAAEPPPPTYDELFKTWPKDERCKLAIVFTGEMNGYLEPCGCSEGQFGGLPRRSGLINMLRSQFGMTVVPIDLGDLVEIAGPLERLRYEAAVAALEKMKYEALAVGSKDLFIGAQQIASLLLNQVPIKHLWGNLNFKDKTLFDLVADELKKQERKNSATRTILAGGQKIVVASVVDPAEIKNLAECDPQPLEPAAREALAAMKTENATIKVLLAYTSFKEARKLAVAVPGFDLIVSRAEAEDGRDAGFAYFGAAGEPKTLVGWAGRKGKHVALAGYFPGETIKLRYANVALGMGIPKDPAIDKVYAQFVQDIKDGDFAKDWRRYPGEPGNGFSGAEKCGKCHTKAYAKWLNYAGGPGRKGHGAALETLRKAVPPGQDHNPECLKCHTLAFETKGGFVTPALTPQFGGNQCENCHGPGELHSAQPKASGPLQAIRRSVASVKAESSGGNGGCVKCHDAENSVKFNFDKYWDKIKHPGKD